MHLAGDPDEGLLFTFDGTPEVGGVAAEWAVMAAIPGDEVTYFTAMADAEGHAELEVPPAAGEVYIGVIPTPEIGEAGASWSWAVETVPDTTSDDTAETTGDDTAETTGGDAAQTTVDGEPPVGTRSRPRRNPRRADAGRAAPRPRCSSARSC